MLDERATRSEVEMGKVRTCALCVVVTDDEELAGCVRARSRWDRCVVVACAPALLAGFVRAFTIDHLVIDERGAAAAACRPPAARTSVWRAAAFDAVVHHVDAIVAEAAGRDAASDVTSRGDATLRT